MPRYDQIDWEQAACLGMYTDLFYSVEEERSTHAYYYINAVRMTCARCPLWEACLTYAFNNENYGVWGGLTSLERASFRNPEKYERQRDKAQIALGALGISEERLVQIYERSRDELSMGFRSQYDGQDDFASDS